MLSLILKGQSDRIDEFIEMQSALDLPMLSGNNIAAFTKGELLNPGDEIQSNLVGAVFQHFKVGRRMTPAELFIAGVRIVEMAATDLTGHLKSLGYDWYVSEWTRVAAEQRFQLRLPAAIDDAIIHVVALGKTGHVGIAAMALSMRGQVNVNLPADTLAMLRGTAAQ